MMKKFLYTITSVLILATSANAQDKGSDFDKKFRFGLRITPQPTWFSSSDNNNKPYGAKFGFGFGLNMEFKFSDIVALQTGIGGDFEGGNYSFRYDPGNYEVYYWQNSANEFVAPKKNEPRTDLFNKDNTGYLVSDRTIKTTHVTIPAILKMSTNEYSGFKYFGMFGLELGIRVKATATDRYHDSFRYTNDATGLTITSMGAGEQANINLNKDASLIPMRLGFNVGAGSEYRIGGSTSAFVSINYFRGFTNLMAKESEFLVSRITTDPAGINTYNFVKQNIIMSAIKINIGILF